MEDFGYNLTADLIRKSRTYGMADVHYLIYADLRACGWSMRNAWMVAFNGQGTNWTKDMLEKEMNRLESLESVQKRIEDVKGERTNSVGNGSKVVGKGGADSRRTCQGDIKGKDSVRPRHSAEKTEARLAGLAEDNSAHRRLQ